MTAAARLTRTAFAAIMEFLAAAFGITIEPRRQEVYYRMLSDLDEQTLRQAACRIVSTRVYASLPLVGEIRRNAIAIQCRLPDAPTPVEAWESVLTAIGRTDLEDVIGRMSHPVLREFLASFGRRNWCALVHAEDRGAERRRFEIAYAAFLRDKVEALCLRVPEFNSASPRTLAVAPPRAARAAITQSGGFIHGDS